MKKINNNKKNIIGIAAGCVGSSITSILVLGKLGKIGKNSIVQAVVTCASYYASEYAAEHLVDKHNQAVETEERMQEISDSIDEFNERKAQADTI